MSSVREVRKKKAAARLVFTLLAGTIVASIAFATAYALGGQTQACAAALCIATGMLAAAMVVWEHEVMPRKTEIEDRGSLPSGEKKNDAAASAFDVGTIELIAGRGWFVRLLAAAIGTLGLAALFPLRSLAPDSATVDEFARTSWRKGLRLVRSDGSVVRPEDVEIDSVLTVFPQGHVGPKYVDDMANDATMLVHVPPEELKLPPGRAGWAPQGLIAFSKVCTHAGCPVALYRAAARQLFCPCHQSTFDVLTGGTRTFGPAARGLPQLPIAIAADGTLEALGDYPEPIGPGYWERG